MSNFLDAITLAYPKKELQTAPTGQEALYLDKDDWNDLCQRITGITNLLSGAFQVFKADGSASYGVLAVSGSPNGVTSASKGSLAVDIVAAALYQNTDGGTAWSAVGGGDATIPDSEFYGTGVDGAVHFDGTTTLLGVAPATRDGITKVYTFARDIDLADGTIIDSGVSVNMPNFRFKCNGTCTNNGIISFGA